MPREQTQFKPGQTGNPGGRPKGVAALARQHGEAAIDVLADLLMDENAATRARIQAARELLDRAYGKPVAMTADVTDTLDDVSDEELREMLDALREAREMAQAAAEEETAHEPNAGSHCRSRIPATPKTEEVTWATRRRRVS